jgi:carbon-monoxide dehydrogenase medium subunit
LAGGTDLLVQLRQGLLDAHLLVDVKSIPELSRLSFRPEEGLVVGAAVPLYRIYEHADVAAHYPALAEVARLIGGPAVQGRATLGGNLCNAAPSADSVPAMMVLGATCTVAGPRGSRTVAVEDFCLAPGQTVLARDEMLVSLHFSPPRPRSGACYLRFCPRGAGALQMASGLARPRGEMDIAVAGVGAWLALSEDGAVVAGARLALGAVGPTPLLASAAGEWLVGRAPTDEAFAEAAALAQEVARPITDVRGTAAQRRHLVGVLTRRALEGARQRAKEA